MQATETTKTNRLVKSLQRLQLSGVIEYTPQGKKGGRNYYLVPFYIEPESPPPPPPISSSGSNRARNIVLQESADRRNSRSQAEFDEEDLMRLYLHDIGQYALIDKEGEVRLAKIMEAGRVAAAELANPGGDISSSRQRQLRKLVRDGQQARLDFIQANYRLVVSIAKRYQNRGLPMMDLIQEGNFGMMHAVDLFDWRKGFKFSTYATWWIRQHIVRGIANTAKVIRLPVHAGDTLVRIQKARSGLELKLGRPATTEEIATEIEMPVDKVTEAIRYASDPLSLSEPLREDGDAELGDFIKDPDAIMPEDELMQKALTEEVRLMLRKLEKKEALVLTLLFGLDQGEKRSKTEVAEYLEMTVEHVNRLLARGISKLRHPSTSDIGEFLLD